VVFAGGGLLRKDEWIDGWLDGNGDGARWVRASRFGIISQKMIGTIRRNKKSVIVDREEAKKLESILWFSRIGACSNMR
jgi:hypothetical protein